MLTCPNCRCPLVGNETFCSNCGTRVFAAEAIALPRGGRRARGWRVVLAIAAALLLLAVLGAAGIRLVRHRPRIDRRRSAAVMPSFTGPHGRFEERVRRFSEL